ncbi:Zn-dependent protease with chaperone function [Bacillus capparidis]|uniref:Zn-dependent protease with chaperone function n=1 Tax=Bacillus capparidis TaxID=1840411 RepID=A0ABS4CTD5_9BACI|nr:Zn-dependent protease with chaperone function [Bacillus capparidis]
MYLLKKLVLLLLLLINVFYIVNYLINFEFISLSYFWLVSFIISLVLSTLYLFRSRKQSGYNPYLSVAVLVASISSIGAYGFKYFIANLMG